MTTIKHNDQEYSLEQLIRIHTEGSHQAMGPNLNLTNVDEAQVVGTISDFIAVAGNAKLHVLVRPADTSKAKGVYILSKYLLKKASVATRYESVAIQSPRERSYDQRRDSRGPRDFGYRSDRPSNGERFQDGRGYRNQSDQY